MRFVGSGLFVVHPPLLFVLVAIGVVILSQIEHLVLLVEMVDFLGDPDCPYSQDEMLSSDDITCL